MDEKVLATYAAYKGYFPNSIIIKDSAKAIFESGRTKESSYQKVNKQIKLLKKHGLLVKHGNGLRLLSKMEISQKYHTSDFRKFAHTPNAATKEIRLELVKIKLQTRLTQIEFRRVVKSERPNKSIVKYVSDLIKKQGAFTQVSILALAKALNMTPTTLSRKIKQLYLSGDVSIIGGGRQRVRRLAKLEQPYLRAGEFIYKGWVYKVTSPSLRVNDRDTKSTILHSYQLLDAINTSPKIINN